MQNIANFIDDIVVLLFQINDLLSYDTKSYVNIYIYIISCRFLLDNPKMLVD